MSEVDNLRKEIKNLVCEQFIDNLPLHGDFSKAVLAMALLSMVHDCNDVEELQVIKRRLAIAGSTSPSSSQVPSSDQT